MVFEDGFVAFEADDEVLTDDFAFLFGFGDAFEFAEELIVGIDDDEVGVKDSGEGVVDLLGFVLAEETVIYEDTSGLATNTFGEEGGDDATINSTGDGAENLSIADG